MRIVGPTRFEWLGRAGPGAPAWVRRSMPEIMARHYLVEAMAACIYRGLYVAGGLRSVSAIDPGQRAGDADAPFLETLTAANEGSGPWQSGWRIRDRRGEDWRVSRDGLTILAAADACRSVDGGEIDRGSEILLHLPKELPGYAPGYFMVLGNRSWPRSDPEAGVRLYWNLIPGGAARFVHLVSGSLNAEEIPFCLKVLHAPSAYERCDAGVVYAPAAHINQLRTALQSPYRSLKRWLKIGAPAWTCSIGHGVAFADDPPKGDSFGMSRCRAVAEGITAAQERGALTLGNRVAVVNECLRAVGIDPEKPYLNPGSTSWFDAFD